jgi:hypothetical protein
MASRAAQRFLVGAALSPGVSHFLLFSLGFAVSFAVSISLLFAPLRLVRVQMASHCRHMYPWASLL